MQIVLRIHAGADLDADLKFTDNLTGRKLQY